VNTTALKRCNNTEILITYLFFTLGIKDLEVFGKKWKKIVGVAITLGSPQTQRNRVAARR